MSGFIGTRTNDAGIPISASSVTQDDGTPLLAQSPRTGSELVIGTHNFGDVTTWFGDSVRVEDQAMEAKAGSGGLVWKSTDAAHVNWIDMRTGRMHNQEKWVDESLHGYAVSVTVDGTEKTPCPTFVFDQGTGDYWIDYDTGEIHFFADMTGSTITACFSYAAGSTFYLHPAPGKILRIEDAETDFSSDTVLKTAFGYIVVGYVDVFAPQYMRGSNELDPVLSMALANPPDSPTVGDRYIVAGVPTGAWDGHAGDIAQWGGTEWAFTVPQAEDWTTVVDAAMYFTFRGGEWTMTPYPPGTQIPLQEDFYHRVSQIITEARGALPPVTALGASAEELQITDLKEFRRKSRGMKHSVQAIPFNYATARDLHSNYGMELQVLTLDHAPVQGEHLTITFYCTSKDETP